MAPSRPSLSACGQHVRRFDIDRYYTCLLAPDDRREDMFALYAFNIEVAKTREIVSEPLMGRIRLQWWRDVIRDAVEGRPSPRHDIAGPLNDAIQRRGLDQASFDAVLEAREYDLEEETQPATLADLEAYAEATASRPFQLALAILGTAGEAEMEASRHLGIAWSLVGLIRATRFLAGQRICKFPHDVLEAAGAQRADLFELRTGPALRQATEQLLDRCEVHLSVARSHRPGVDRNAIPVLGAGVIIDEHLKLIRKSGNDPLNPRLQRPNPLRQAKLAARAYFGQY